MENKLNKASRDNVLEQMLNMCGHTGSFSDACSAIVIQYFSTIYTHLQENFKAENICHLSGQCTSKFHKHEEPGKVCNRWKNIYHKSSLIARLLTDDKYLC